MELWLDRLGSPLGEILVVTDDRALYALDFADYEPRMLNLLGRRFEEIQFTTAKNPLGICDRLHAYFAGDLNALQEIPVNPGGTEFQQRVWQTLRSIPVGTVLSYGQLATQLNKPSASRAVGMANSLNPIAIVLPCHRVIGANATLTGYAGGLDRKRWLLNHEGVTLDPLPSQQQLALF